MDTDKILTKNLPDPEPAETQEDAGMLDRFKRGLSKTRRRLVAGLRQSLLGDAEIDEELLDEVEERLLAADIGVPTTRRILNRLESEIERGDLKTRDEAFALIRSLVETILGNARSGLDLAGKPPRVIMMIGVNGVGKTTTIGKLAAKYQAEGKKVLLAAGDTFRAGAIEQLKAWSERAGADLVAKTQDSDPSATLFEASRKALEGYDLLLCDTSGRLHTKKNLMDELSKMKRVLKKNIPDAPHATLLVLDANTGQNAMSQTKEFMEIIGVDGLIVTKLDGTAKGGAIIGIVNEFELPVHYVGLGEKIEDLGAFDGRLVAESLFSE